MISIVIVLVAFCAVAMADTSRKYLTMTTTSGAGCDGDIVQQVRYSLGFCMSVVDYTLEDDTPVKSATFTTSSTSSLIQVYLNYFSDEECEVFVDTLNYAELPTTCVYSDAPTPSPTDHPTSTPTEWPTMTEHPSAKPTHSPSAKPTKTGTVTFDPSFQPTFSPSVNPSAKPSFEPTSIPTHKPTGPTKFPTAKPSAVPTVYSPPTTTPSFAPTTPDPTVEPTRNPTMENETYVPTSAPTTGYPSPYPSDSPTLAPTAEGTAYPTSGDYLSDDVVPDAHSVMYTVTSEINTPDDVTGNYWSVSSPDTECGNDDNIIIFGWNTHAPTTEYQCATHVYYNLAHATQTTINATYSAGKTGPKGAVRCFAGSEVVTLESGELKPLAQVQLGDRVLSMNPVTGEAKFSSVIALPHGRNAHQAVYSYLTTASGKDLLLTAEHLIAASPSCDESAKPILMMANELSVDMCVVSVDKGLERVTSLKHGVSSMSGIYTLVAEEEWIVVNGLVASPFAVNHAVSNAYYEVIRAFPVLAQFEVIRKAGEVFGSLVEFVSL